jgi:hypothetical protein
VHVAYFVIYELRADNVRLKRMGFGVGRRARLAAWGTGLIGALVLTACEPANEDDTAGATPDAGGASEDDVPSAFDEPETRDAEPKAGSDPDVGPSSSSSGSSGSSDAGAKRDAQVVDVAPPVDLCGQVPTAGRCVDERSFELCAVATGMGQDHVESHACAAEDHCVEVSGRAKCVLSKSCVVGTTRCTGTALETCAGEHWQAAPCSNECTATPLGAFCAEAAPTRRFEGRVQYERRLPNAKLTDWETTSALTPARGFLVMSYHQDTLIDAVLSSDAEVGAGTFALRVREPASADDSIVVMAAGVAETQELAFAVADPGFKSSPLDREAGSKTDDAAIWSYRFGLTEVASTGVLSVLEKHGSAACHVFDRLRKVYDLAHDYYRPDAAESIVVWLGIGTQWNCGACTSWSPTQAFDTRFEHQIWLDGSRDQGYWSEPVTAHELGHYVMNAYGYPVGEGGPHFLAVPTHPGQAFSEGWATFFASMVRDDSVYYDKQGSAFFWWDLDRRAYSSRSALWARATPWLGLLQLMDENEAAAIMWQSYRVIAAQQPVLAAVASQRMRVAPFARGYTRRIWSDAQHPDVFQTTLQPLPCLADFLDALRCSNALDASALGTIVEPTTHYPYLSETPLCN